MEVDVFERSTSNDPTISAAAYNVIMGLTLCWGFAVNWLMVAKIDPQTITETIPWWMFFVGYFASCFFGVYLFNGSDNPLVSFVGYNFVVLPFGVIINLVVSQYDANLVLEAVRVTGLVTVGMMFLGSMFPGFFARISVALTVALLLAIVVQLVHLFILGFYPEVVDWIVVLIFCGYIGFDWGRANQIPKTLDNAVDSAAALYMDIINLFLYILRIMGRK